MDGCIFKSVIARTVLTLTSIPDSSMSGNALPRAALKVPNVLGLGRYVCQLKRITFKFCKSRHDSVGMRDFIEKDIVNFARENPSVVVYLKPRRHRSPLMVAEYCKFFSLSFFVLIYELSETLSLKK